MKTMTAEAQARFLAAHARGEGPVPRDYAEGGKFASSDTARADSIPGDGLRMKEITDPYAKKVMYEFERAPGVDHMQWMDKWRGKGFEQLRGLDLPEGAEKPVYLVINSKGETCLASSPNVKFDPSFKERWQQAQRDARKAQLEAELDALGGD